MRQRAGLRWPMLAGLVALALVLPAQATAAEVPDANCPGPETRNAYSGRFGGEREAQTFRVLHTGTLTRAAVQINNTSGSSDFTLQILATDANGMPVGGPLSSATIPGASVPKGRATLDSALSPGVPVVAGQAYALVIFRGGSLLNNFSFPAVDSNCIGDTWYSNGLNAAWNLDVPGVDLLYQMFVDAAPGSGPGGGGAGGKGPGSGEGSNAGFELLNKKGRLYARVPGPGRLIVDDGRKPASTSRAKKKHRVPNLVKRTKVVAKKAGKVPLRLELTNRAVRRILKTKRLNTWGRVTYTPRGGTPSSLVFRIRVHI